MSEASQPRIAFIGAGNMAAAIMGGLLAEGYSASNIWATDLDEGKLQQLQADWGINVSSDNLAVAAQVDVLILAVKPQGLKAVCQHMADTITAHKPLVISIAAGIEIDSLTSWLGEGVPLVRCMPNTPSLVKTGASGLFANASVTAEQRQQAESVMSAVGLALWVNNEAEIDAVTAVSGSGPAYYFMVMEAMIDAGTQLGLSPEVARQLTLQTALGAATMASKSEFEPAELRRRVCSPNGTTERAIMRFEQGGLQPLFADAMNDCAERSRQLAKELGDG